MGELAESETKRNVDILKEAYALWNDSKAESVAHWLNMIDENVHWRSLAGGADGMEFTGECCNKKEVENYFNHLGGEWSMNHYTVDEFIAQDDRVVMVGSCGWTNKKTDKSIDTPKVDIIRMKDSKIVDFYELYDTAMTLNAAN